MRFLKGLLNNRDGRDLLEYALILALVALFSAALLRLNRFLKAGLLDFRAIGTRRKVRQDVFTEASVVVKYPRNDAFADWQRRTTATGRQSARAASRCTEESLDERRGFQATAGTTRS
jgi:hypothetical protein